MPRLEVNLDCLKTTEAGEDEIYILTAWQTSDGRKGGTRYPNNLPHQEAGHWNMNDNGNDGHVNGIWLDGFDLADGQTATIDVVIMEEDGGTSKDAQEVAGAILANSDDPDAQQAASILSIINALGLNIHDTDDYIGSFAVKIHNAGGQLSTQWTAKDRVFQQDPEGFDQFLPANSQRFRMNGDGSTYHCTAYVKA